MADLLYELHAGVGVHGPTFHAEHAIVRFA